MWGLGQPAAPQGVVCVCPPRVPLSQAGPGSPRCQGSPSLQPAQAASLLLRAWGFLEFPSCWLTGRGGGLKLRRPLKQGLPSGEWGRLEGTVLQSRVFGHVGH